MRTLSRYSNLISDGKMANLPKVKISLRNTDKFETYDSKQTRLDRISGKVYGDDSYGWLILLANPEYFLEFDIPSNTIIRVPFPLQDAQSEFVTKVLDLKNK